MRTNNVLSLRRDAHLHIRVPAELLADLKDGWITAMKQNPVLSFSDYVVMMLSMVEELTGIAAPKKKRLRVVKKN